MKTQHTKGEWEQKGHIIESVETHEEIAWIKALSTGSSRSAEAEANAKLIAAAPSMIEALQSVNNYFIDLQNKCALTFQDERAWKLVSKAIQKAIGE